MLISSRIYFSLTRRPLHDVVRRNKFAQHSVGFFCN